MKKLTASIFATLLAVVSVDAAQASIASKGYVDDQVGAVTTELATKADQSEVTTLSGKVTANESAIEGINTTIGRYGDIVTRNASEFATSAQGDLADTAVQPSDITNVERTTNKTTSISGTSTDTQYPSAKAVYTAIETATADIASDADVTALEGRVTTAEGDITALEGRMDTAEGDITALEGTVATKADATALNAKADKATTLEGYGITDAYTKTQTDGLLGAKADASALDNYVTTTDANANYAVKGTEGVASTASTNASQALTNIGTLTTLTTDAKTNTVAAINEVASEAATAQSTATAAQSAASAAQEAADAAQGDVDTLEGTVTTLTGTVNSQGTRLTTAEGEIDDIQGQLQNVASSETVAGLQSAVTNLEDTKQDKTDNSLATTNKTVVGAINEVNTAAQGAADAAAVAQSTADDAADAAAAADFKAQAAQSTANAAIPNVTATGSDGVYVLTAVTAGGTATYKWEQIQRGTDGE